MTSDLRRRALGAIEDLDGATATGPAVLCRLRSHSTEADAVAGADEPGIYPVLHRLEADWQVRATWQIGADGTPHRTYRRRRLMPRWHRKGELA
jgi:DNA-binding PadR family transcriptional regulator